MGGTVDMRGSLCKLGDFYPLPSINRMDKFKISVYSKRSFKYIRLKVVQTLTSKHMDQ